MKIHNIIEAINYYQPPKADPKVVDKFAGVADSQRSYYIMKWAEEKGINSDDAMYMAGYVQDGYMGAGAYNWRYVGLDEAVEEGKCKQCGKEDCKCKPGECDCPPVNEAEEGMIGEPDNWYDAEERKEAHDQLQDALEQCDSVEADYVKDGICPNCAGSSYIDGDYGEEEDSCDGWGNYGCDEGEMEYMNDTVSWKAIKDHDEKSKQKAELAKKPQPSDEILAGAMKQLHRNYVETGRFNAMELPSILRQMYPEISKQKAREIGSKFFKTFDTMNDPEPATVTMQWLLKC